MITAPDRAGPHNPEPTTLPRRQNSIRRTSSVDTTRAIDNLLGTATLDARARDLLTNADGVAVELAALRMAARFSRLRELESITADPAAPGLDRLVGAIAGPGFRAKVAAAIPGEVATRSLLHLIVDDLPGTTLVSGYTLQRSGAVETTTAHERTRERVVKAENLCSGWATGATILALVHKHGGIPTPLGPPAPTPERTGDALDWHAMAPLPPHGMRRRRRLDVIAAEDSQLFDLDAHFRDSHVDAAGRETVLHEYALSARVDGASRIILAIEGAALVLPWQECPYAIASASRLIGTPIDNLRQRVSREFVGTSTCSHFNDMLRTLADAGVMLDRLQGMPRRTST